MWQVNGTPILEDEMTILLTLKTELAKNGIDILRKFKRTRDSIQICCPFHKQGQEQKPSCGISTADKKRADGSIIKAGAVHCFTCQYTSNLQTMISNCFGYDDHGRFGVKWLINNFNTAKLIERTPLQDLPDTTIKNAPAYILEEELDSYRFYHDYMFARGLTQEIIEIFDVGFDANFRLETKDKNGNKTLSNKIPSITFPVKDRKGNVLFVARRSIRGKLFHYPNDALKPVYGLHELYKYWDVGVVDGELHTLEHLVVCESIFNALTCWVYGVPAVALLGTGTADQFKTIARIPVDQLILGFDPDEAGRNAVKKFLNTVKKQNIVILQLPENRDINDLTEDEFWSAPRVTPLHVNF